MLEPRFTAALTWPCAQGPRPRRLVAPGYLNSAFHRAGTAVSPIRGVPQQALPTRRPGLKTSVTERAEVPRPGHGLKRTRGLPSSPKGRNSSTAVVLAGEDRTRGKPAAGHFPHYVGGVLVPPQAPESGVAQPHGRRACRYRLIQPSVPARPVSGTVEAGGAFSTESVSRDTSLVMRAATAFASSVTGASARVPVGYLSGGCARLQDDERWDPKRCS